MAVDLRPSDVNAVARNHLVISCQVDRGDGVLVAVSAAAAGWSGDGEDTAKQMARVGHITFTQQLADVAAGDHLSANLQLRIDADRKPKSCTELYQLVHVTFGLMSEVEV